MTDEQHDGFEADLDAMQKGVEMVVRLESHFKANSEQIKNAIDDNPVANFFGNLTGIEQVPQRYAQATELILKGQKQHSDSMAEFQIALEDVVSTYRDTDSEHAENLQSLRDND